MTIEVKVCTGSACFAKGNQENLEYIKEYIQENNLEANISIVGTLYENKFLEGPRIIINEKEYTNITKEHIIEVIEACRKK